MNENQNTKSNAKNSHNLNVTLKQMGELSLDDLPQVPDTSALNISFNSEESEQIGQIHGIVDRLVIVESLPNKPAYDMDTLLFLNKGKQPLGYIFDVFVNGTPPMYTVRFNQLEDIVELNITKGMPVYSVPKSEEHTKYVFLQQLLKMRGSDASTANDLEVASGYGEHFSDDEEEGRYASGVPAPGPVGQRRKRDASGANVSSAAHRRFEAVMNERNRYLYGGGLTPVMGGRGRGRRPAAPSGWGDTQERGNGGREHDQDYNAIGRRMFYQDRVNHGFQNNSHADVVHNPQRSSTRYHTPFASRSCQAGPSRTSALSAVCDPRLTPQQFAPAGPPPVLYASEPHPVFGTPPQLFTPSFPFPVTPFSRDYEANLVPPGVEDYVPTFMVAPPLMQPPNPIGPPALGVYVCPPPPIAMNCPPPPPTRMCIPQARPTRRRLPYFGAQM